MIFVTGVSSYDSVRAKLLKINAAIRRENIDSGPCAVVQSAQLDGVSDGELAGRVVIH